MADELGFIELPDEFAPIEEWIETRATLREVKQTPEVKELLARCDRIIEAKRAADE